MRAALLIAGVALLVGAAPAQAGKTVRIYDNYFLKDDITVKRGAVVTWRWPEAYEAGDVHDVKLKSGPEGREEVPVGGGRHGLHVQAQAPQARALPDRLHAPRRDADEDPGAPVTRS